MAWATWRTWVAGEVVTAALLNQQIRDNENAIYPLGDPTAAWTTFTPQIDQGASTNITKTVTYSAYTRMGRTLFWDFRLDMTAGGTGGSVLTLTIPAAPTSTIRAIGSGYIASAGTVVTGTWLVLSATTIGIVTTGSNGNAWGNSPVTAIANGDSVRGAVVIETAA